MKKLLTLALLAAVPAAFAQKKPEPVKSVRLYIFENGVLKGMSPKTFNFEPNEVKATEFIDVSYLIVHPKGTLMWDTGVLPDSAFKGDGQPVTQGITTASKPLLPQLAAIGYTPADITYLGLSHYHSDHTANANAFAGSTWLVHQNERDAMFAEKPANIINQKSFSELKNAKTKILDEKNYDVFGDGTVVIMYTPGHTPGHQVLLLKLKKTGRIVLAGDLYHYPEERTTGKTPTFEFNKEQSAVSRKAVEDYVKKTKSQLWIEHDEATHAKLKKSPEYYN